MIRNKIRNFRHNHDFMFGIMKSFFMMVITCATLLAGAIPIFLCLYIDFWWILSAFIIWPVGFNSIAWVVDYFDV